MTPFTRGESVRLIRRFAENLNRSSKRREIDWTQRCGTVVSCNPHDVFVIWDGRKTRDQIPVRAVERA